MITWELVLALSSFAFVTTATPGPNNIMLTASGANFGFQRTIPHILGIALGCASMNLGVGLGLGSLFEQFSFLQSGLRFFGSAYLLWLAWQLLRFSGGTTGKHTATQPFSFWQAAVFQYVNPKAWVMVLSANASFSLLGEFYWSSVLLITLVFMLIGIPSISCWAGFGQYIRQYLDNASWLRVFNITMAMLTAACVVFIWI